MLYFASHPQEVELEARNECAHTCRIACRYAARRKGVWKALAMLAAYEAYFDESGTHGEPDGAATIAGFVAVKDVWAEVQNLWDAEIATWADYGVKTYHATDCLWGNGEFSSPRLDQFKRHVIIHRVANILGDHDVQAVYSQVLNDEWNAATADEVAFLARYPKPYDFMFDDIVHQLHGWSKRRIDGKKIAPIFAVQSEYAERSHALLEFYLKRPSWQESLTSVTFSTPQQMTALQCADHLAFWVRFEREKVENKPITLENGGYVLALENAVRMHGLHQGGCWTFASLRNAIAEFNRRGTLALA